MPEIIDHLASLTGLRDRDTLDVSLAQAMRDLIAPERVAIYRLVGDPGNERADALANRGCETAG